MTQPHILIAAGGTGGHVFPGIAIAHALQQQGAQVSWLASAQGKEKAWVEQAQLPVHTVHVQPLRGSGLKRRLQFPKQLITAVHQSIKIIKQLQPDLILGLGGFVSGPAGLAAFCTHKPLALHEQNSIAGLTNRTLAHLASLLFESVPNTFKPTRARCIFSGNPVRADIAAIQKKLKGTPQQLLILGGSQGARVFNQVIPEFIARLPKQERPEIWHQAGQAEAVSLRERYQQLGINARVDAFIQNMPEAYQFADVLISRAGATTLAELVATRIPAILVPLPHAVDDHQTQNARSLSDRGAAILMPQAEFNAERLVDQWQQWRQNPAQWIQMHQQLTEMQTTDAASHIAEICLAYCHQGK